MESKAPTAKEGRRGGGIIGGTNYIPEAPASLKVNNAIEANSKPRAIAPNPQYIPTKLRDVPQWVCWRYEWRQIKGGEWKWTKTPVTARTGRNASSTEPATWSDFNTAFQAYSRLNCDGIGFVLSKSDQFVGIDLDHCRDASTGEIEPWAKAIIENMATYAEASPSGTGIRMFVVAKLPPNGRKKGPIEVYESGRYLTVTGCRIEGAPSTVEPRQSQVDAFHAKTFGTASAPVADLSAVQASRPVPAIEDRARLERAFASKNGQEIKALFHGVWQDRYASQSEADSALCCHLAFWFGRDPMAIDRVFRLSGLMRPKWDAPARGGETYGAGTIARAIAITAEISGQGNLLSGTSGTSGGAYSSNGCGMPEAESGQSGTSGWRVGQDVPGGFVNDKTGLYRLEEDQEGAVQEVWLGPRLDVLGMTRDTSSGAWGLYIEWRDPDGKLHRWAMPLSMLSRDDSAWHSTLADGGWIGAPGRKARQSVATYLATSRPKARVRCVERTGWHGPVYVFPDEAVGSTGEMVVLQREVAESVYRRGGTLEDWQEGIAKLAQGNSRLVLAISAAFAAALLEVAGQESGGFNLVGGSSTGKSTALHAAGSACGGGGISGFVRNWRATSNGLEGLASMHCDSPLCLDELGQADARAVSEAAYMLANGSGKSRASRDGTHRTPATWRTLVFSSGEIGLAAKIQEETGRTVKAGQEVRLVDIPADAGKGMGLFEDLHGHSSPTVFADSIKRAAATHYGHAFRVFIARMVADMDKTRAEVLQAIPAFVARACPADADGQVRRVAARFALCAVAGEMATEWGILPWRAGEAIEAAKRCLGEWISARGGAGASEDRAILSAVRLFIEQHGAARFQDLDEEGGASADRCINRAGFRRKTPNGHEFIFLPSVFSAEVLRGHDASRAAKVLKQAGWLRTNEKGLQVKVALPGLGRPRCYVVALPDEQEG